MTRSSKHYRAPTRVRLPNHLPVIFNTARLRRASSRVRRLAQTVLRVYVHSLLLLLAVRSCVQLIGHTAEAVKTLATDPNQSSLSLASDQFPDEYPLTEVIDDCLSSLFGKWAWHGPGDCGVDCPQVAVKMSDGHLNTCLIEVPLQDTLQNPTGPVCPEGTSGQWQLLLPVASYSTAFKTMFRGITFPIDFILWHTTLLSSNTFIHISLILYEFGPPLWTMNRETWRKLRKASSLSGKRGISRCRKTRVFLCVYLCALSTHCLCMAFLKRFKHQALSKRIGRQLVRFPSLGLGRGVRCGQKIHGHLVTSFTVQKSFVKRIRVRPHYPCPVLPSPVAHHSKSVTKAVTVRSCVFLGLLLLLAGDIESNPGPRKEKEREASAEDILDLFREQFLKYVDAKAVIGELRHNGIVPQSCQENVAKADAYRQRNNILHDCLKRTCTREALIKACDIIIALAEKGGEESNPNMKKVGEDMKMKLGTGPRRGSESEGEKEFQHFSDALRDEYQKITVVFAPHKLEQEMEFINLALSRFVPKSEDDHLKFVRSMTEGVDSTFTELQGKVEYGSIMSLVKEYRLVVISGAPGTGKTTLTKKLCKEVSRDMASHGYKLVVKVELRDLVPLVQDPSSFELKQLMDLFESVGEMERVVGRMKATCGADTLLILDGYDELPHDLRHSPFFVNLLSLRPLRSPLRKSHIILTSRSIVMSEIHRRFQSAEVRLVNIEVLGFTSEQIQHFIDQYFEGEGKSELSAKLSVKLDALPHIKGLCSIPVVLSIISRVFLSRKDLPPTLTQLYDEFVCETLSSMFPGLQSTLKIPVKDHDFLKLCKIANECTMQQKLIFTSSDLMGLQDKYSNRETGCGLLTARPVDKLRCTIAESFFFIHFTVQEFLTAAHIARLEVAAQCAFWDEHLGQPHLAQTWRFYCGITKMAHYDLLQNSKVRGIKGFDELLMQSFFETQDRDLVGRLMPSVMGEEVKVEPKTAYDSIAFGFCLEQHSSLQHLKVELPRGGVVAEVQRLLEPCLRHRQLQTLTIEEGLDASPETWRQVEDLFDRIRNCGGTLKGHFGKVHLVGPPLSVAVKLLCLQHVREVECYGIEGCEAMDHEVLKEMEKALGESKALETLRLSWGNCHCVALRKEFCRHLVCGIQLNTSLSEVDLNFEHINWYCPIDVPAEIHGSVQHVTLRNVPVDVLPKLFLWFSQAKHFECHSIYPPQEAMDHEVLKEMEKALGVNKTLEKLTLSHHDIVCRMICGYDESHKEFCRHLLCGIQLNASLSEVDLNFEPFTWDCPLVVPADIHGSVQHVSLRCVQVDVLPKLFLWFSQAKHFECHCICPPQECGMSDEDVKFTEVEQTLSGMGRLEKLVLGIDSRGMSDSLMVEFGVSVLKGISGNQHTSHFVLNDDAPGSRVHLLQSIINRLPTSVQRQFIIDKYTDEDGATEYERTLPCIRRSASGHPTLPWAPPQHFHPRPAYPHLSAVGYDTHSVGQHQVPPPPRWPPLPTPQPFDPRWMVPSAMALQPYQGLPPQRCTLPLTFPPGQEVPSPCNARQHPHSVWQHQDWTPFTPSFPPLFPPCPL